MQNTPGDTFDVDIEWADDNNGNKIVEHYTVVCRDLDPEPACETDPLNLGPPEAPTNANWSSSPSFELPALDQSFLPFVTLTVTNSYGATVKQAFPVVGEHRPRYDDRTPYVRMEIGKFNRVKVTNATTSDLRPGATLQVQDYVNQIADQLPAGLGPDIDDIGPPGGEYELQLRGQPESSDIGLYTFYFPVAQYPDHPAGDPAPAQVVLDIVPSVEPGFRAILSDVPSGGSFSIYRTGFPDYAVQIPYETPPLEDPADDPEYAGTVTCRLEAGPMLVFEKPCAVNQQFPWPAGIPDDDSWTASVVAGPSGSDTVNPTKYETSFNTQVLVPTLTRDAVAAQALKQPVRLAVQDFVAGFREQIPKPFSASDYDVACRNDAAKAFTPCLDNGSMLVARTPGAHVVRARVTAPDGAEVTRTLSWTVGTPATDLKVKARKTPWKAGKKGKVKISGLLPGESYKVFLAGKKVKGGVASLAGKAKPRIKVPGKTAAGKQPLKVQGATKQRSGKTKVKVVTTSRVQAEQHRIVVRLDKLHW